MILYPAIDLFDGECVRLSQGRFDQKKVYYPNPLDAVKRWVGEGAAWLHVVDLNGALQGKPVNFAIIEQIIATAGIPVQIGGGIRSRATAESLLKMGAGRIVLGSAALEEPALVQDLASAYKGRIGLSLDARNGKLAVHGWTEVREEEALPAAIRFASMGISAIVYTDISRDGMMSGPNFEASESLIQAVKTPVIVSGGISSLEDIRRCQSIGAGGAILGRSLYEGAFSLKEALKQC